LVPLIKGRINDPNGGHEARWPSRHEPFAVGRDVPHGLQSFAQPSDLLIARRWFLLYGAGVASPLSVANLLRRYQ
jgi:hypothetical protein